MPVRTVIERGPKGKRSVTFTIDWPGWSRGARTAELALETLESYRERYRSIAGLAGMAREFDAAGRLDIVEENSVRGRPTSGASPSRPPRPSRDRWARRSSSAGSPCSGPVGRSSTASGHGSRRRCVRALEAEDATGTIIIRHTIRTESEDFAKQVGLRIPEGAALTPDGLRQHREAYVAAMRAYNVGEIKRRMRSWTLPFLIRHSAFHTLDHAWEMEDKDLSAEDG